MAERCRVSCAATSLVLSAWLRAPLHEIIGMSGLHARPLHDGTTIDAVRVHVFWQLWPAGRRVLPMLLPAVDSEVEQAIAVVQRLDAAPRRPVSLEDFRSLSQVTDDMHHAHTASNQERVECGPLGAIPGHLPAHELAIPGALFVRALAEGRVGDVARMHERELADLGRVEGAPLALLGRGAARVPHE